MRFIWESLLIATFALLAFPVQGAVVASAVYELGKDSDRIDLYDDKCDAPRAPEDAKRVVYTFLTRDADPVEGCYVERRLPPHEGEPEVDVYYMQFKDGDRAVRPKTEFGTPSKPKVKSDKPSVSNNHPIVVQGYHIREAYNGCLRVDSPGGQKFKACMASKGFSL